MIEKHENTYEVTHRLINMGTGEYRDIRENEKIKIESPIETRSNEYLDYQKMINNRDELSNVIMSECGTFYFNFFDNGLDRVDIKDSIKTRFLYLCTYKSYNSKGMYLIYDNGKKIDKKGLQGILNLSVNEANSTIRLLVDSGLLIKDGNYFMVCDDFVYRGKLKSSLDKEKHTRIFDKGLRDLYNNCNPRQHKQLYYIFKLLPYVSFRFNAICHNPTEQNEEDIVPFKLSEIAETIGYDITHAKKLEKELLKLKVFEQHAFLGIITEDGVWYKVNPRIMYAGTGECLDEFVKLISTDFRVKVKKSK